MVIKQLIVDFDALSERIRVLERRRMRSDACYATAEVPAAGLLLADPTIPDCPVVSTSDGMAEILGRDGAPDNLVGGSLVTESARAHSYFFSKEVQKTGQFWLFTLWLLTFWLFTVYLRCFSHFLAVLCIFTQVDFMVFCSLKPALRAFRGSFPPSLASAKRASWWK